MAGCGCWFLNNDLYNETDTLVDGSSKPKNDTSNITTSPQYVKVSTTDKWSVDLHLTPGSPAINAGENFAIPSVAYGGGPRTVGSKSDIGAYEQ